MKKLLTVLVSLVISIGLVSPSYASGPTWANCPSEKFCTYTDIDGSGSGYYYSQLSAGTCVEVGGIFDNNISSTWGNSGSFPGVILWQGHGCTGLGQSWATGGGKNYSMGSWDNVVSSFSWK